MMENYIVCDLTLQRMVVGINNVIWRMDVML